MIVAGYAGIGKSTYCEAHRETAMDLIIMPFKYSNFYEAADDLEEGESIRANYRLRLRENWILYYYWMLKQLLYFCPQKTIVIPTVDAVMDLLKADGISCTIVYPDMSLREEYRKRYEERGDSEEFIEIFAGEESWTERITRLTGRQEKKMILQRGQFLSDVLPDEESGEDAYETEQWKKIYSLLRTENHLQRLLREKMRHFPRKIEINAILYLRPLNATEFMSEYVCIESQEEVKILLKELELDPTGKKRPVLCLLRWNLNEPGQIRIEKSEFETWDLKNWPPCS